MSRSTQYIGLTADAHAFVRELEEERIVIAEGMFNEEVWGGVWDGRYKEVVQCDPWSGGPMIFTCLYDCDMGEVLYSWTYNFDLDKEFDQVAGTYRA